MEKRDKKAGTTFLPENVLKILLAVMCIVLLLILATKIYGIFIGKTKIEQAKATLDIIEGKIELFKETNNPVTFIINTPKDYYLYLASGDKCNGKYCLCFAPPSSTIEKPLKAVMGYLDESRAICKATEDSLFVQNKNNGENVIGIYQSTPCTITKNDKGHISLIFDTGPTSELQRFLGNLLKKIKR